MPICTAAEVKDSARIDGTEFDLQVDRAIATAQAMLEHECGVVTGTFNAAPDAGAKQCAIAIAVAIITNPAAGRDELHTILRSALLDAARTWA